MYTRKRLRALNLEGENRGSQKSNDLKNKKEEINMAQERKYWNEEIETMPLDKLKRLQQERLQEVVARAYEKTGLYRRKFDEAGIKPQDISTLDDLKKLPLTTYLEDFCKTPISEKLAVPMEEVKVFTTTSGTLSGFTQPIMWTKSEFDKLASEGEVRLRIAMGMTADDIVQPLAADY